MHFLSTSNTASGTGPGVSAYPLKRKITTVEKILRSVKQFFGVQVRAPYRGSRIIRRKGRAFEQFIFKGYDQQTPGLSRPGSFKELKRLCKN
jgi:hypothetical protein